MKKRTLLRVLVPVIVLVMLASLVACSPEEGNGEGESKGKLVFGDTEWESIRFNAHVAGLISELGYGYEYEVIMGATPVMMEGMAQGDVDILTEMWTDNSADGYYPMLEAGEIIDLGVQFVSEEEGLWVPDYVIKGDPERGIEPMAPDLKSVLDLPDYWELFKDPEDSSKGRIVGPPPVWFVSELMDEQIKTYGLDEWYNHFLPGSDVALATEMKTAHEEGRAIVAYHWTPDWVLGLANWILLDEPPFDEAKWEDGYGCKRKPQNVTKIVTPGLPDRAPEIVEFLEKMQISVDIHNKMLAYMQVNDAEAEEAALEFLREYGDVWTTWVPAEVADKIKEAL